MQEDIFVCCGVVCVWPKMGYVSGQCTGRSCLLLSWSWSQPALAQTWAKDRSGNFLLRLSYVMSRHEQTWAFLSVSCHYSLVFIGWKRDQAQVFSRLCLESCGRWYDLINEETKEFNCLHATYLVKHWFYGLFEGYW